MQRVLMAETLGLAMARRAANECLGHFDARPAGDRWCDALLQLLQLAQASGEAG